jgi:hypothetical protein
MAGVNGAEKMETDPPTLAELTELLEKHGLNPDVIRRIEDIHRKGKFIFHLKLLWQGLNCGPDFADLKFSIRITSQTTKKYGFLNLCINSIHAETFFF